ncbi:DcaP family trimeric outer membrane transporter [uncultured Acinetobacter sp.]|uniref:DcaP family trimeric outer membrane transporter n=1 Tax=uncultured Acinetobacter sp. TaxID=165433 RepID=UPI0025836456|nr:DcaP family trimeric outer membrane transporter [uncultured Acinetobacter sp.]
MNKLKTLALSMGTIGLSSLAIPAYAASNTEVDALRKEVNELKQLVQQLSTQQKAAPVVMAPPPAPAPMVAAAPAPKAPSNAKPGWFTLPDGQTQVKLYGSIRGDATYDFEGNPSPNINNNTNSVPLNSANATKNNLNVSAATTRFGFDFSRPTDLGELTGKIEADFAGGIAADSSSRTTNGNGSLRVRHAYFSLGKWLVGQTTSPFVNTDTAPETVDFNGPMGYGSTRTVQVRYTQPIDANQKVLLAVEGGDVDNINSASATTVFKNSGGAVVQQTTTSGGNRLPALTARYDYTTADKKGLVQVHGLVHENRISVNDDVDETKLGWGIGVGGKYSLTPADTVFANYYHVKGDNRYLLYGNSAYVAYQNNATAAANATDLSIYESEFNSGLIGYSHKWSPKVRSTLAAGAIWYKDDNSFAERAPTLNKQLYNVIVNSFYTPTKNVDLGVEYTYGQRKTFQDQEGDYSRLNLMAKYSF